MKSWLLSTLLCALSVLAIWGVGSIADTEDIRALKWGVSKCPHLERAWKLVVDEFNNLQSRIEEEERSSPGNFRLARVSAGKNRYTDIVPYEKTRVHLSRSGGDISDYINANFVADARFIATQAPLPATISDFWQMIWEQKSTVIVMLTKLKEGGLTKADAYWPTTLSQPVTYGAITVQLRAGSRDDHHQTVTRLLRISDGTVSRDLTQLHYVGWPDFGVPVAADDVLQLLKSTKNKVSVVHCSAGIGRAGTFIAIHEALAAVKRGEAVNVPELVVSLRKERPGMVQRAEQYGFIYKALSADCKHRAEGHD